MASSTSLDDIFQTAVANFEASLTEKQRRGFQACSRKEVEDTIRGIENRLASQRRQRNMRRIAKFLEGMDQLGKVVEVFVNVDATVAFLWGPIKFVLLAAGTWVETLDCLLDIYAEIGDFLPSLSQYESLLAKHPELGTHLQKYYCDVLEFHRKALAVFSRPAWKAAFHSAWRTFKTQFGPILTKLKCHRDLLSDEKLIANIVNVNQSIQSVGAKVDELSRQLQQLYLIDDEEASRRHRENVDRKRQFVLSKLDPPDYYYDLERAWNERRDSTSGNWLLTDVAFEQWADTAIMEPRSLYLSGIPGTGKTILTSRVVRYLQKLQEGRNANGCCILLLYFFFKHCQPDKRNFASMLLSLLSQTVFQDEVLLDLIYQRCVLANQQKIRSASLLCELAELVLNAHNICFVVVDALDECAEDQGIKPEDAQGQVIDWLESLMRARHHSEHEASAEPSDRCLRLLISGQRNGLLEERLRHWPTVQLDSSLSHMNDIKTYSEAESLRIQEKFKTEEDTRLDIMSRVNSRAKGMFLYAKVVLGNLLSQPTRGHFKRELREENFPKGMNQAYERVAIYILEGSDEVQSDLARRILDLVICAERPLLWKEIQSRFCIDVQSATADPDFRLLEPGKKYCGSLIEVSRKDEPRPQGSGPDDLVELVHETARRYLLETGRFHLPSLHTNMALFCAQYLCSSPFNPDIGKSANTTHCRAGYYGFLDYAAANWWKHARRIGSCRDNITLRAFANLANSLNPQFAMGAGATADDMTAVWTRIYQLPDDGRDYEDALPIEDRIKPIRHCLESLLGHENSTNSADLGEMNELYGRVRYKCFKPWCQFFHTGFETTPIRDEHVRQHERPFKCGSDGCYGSQIGFAKASELARHDKRLHSNAIGVDFPSGMRSDIFKAAEQGQLEVIQELVACGASVNARNKRKSTPLFLAARAGNYQVCRWLLEHGANVDARCTEQSMTALHAAVANGDVEVAVLLIVDHGADIYACTSTGQSVQTLMEQNHCTRIREAFPPEFWRHNAQTIPPPPPHPPGASDNLNHPAPSETTPTPSAGALAKPAPSTTDPVILTLAVRAATDLQLRDLMRRIAPGDAPSHDLKQFQAIIDAITADINRDGSPTGLSADRPLIDGGAVGVSETKCAQSPERPPDRIETGADT